MAAYNQFPPTIDYGRIIKPMVEAHDALGKLNGLLVNIPNLDLLISPLLTKEAVLSSKIEGTQANLEDVYRYEAEGKTSEDNEQEKDVKEIINYRKAIHEAMRELQSNPINLKLVKATHNTLLNSVRGSQKDRGEIRKVQVFIGTPGSTIKNALYLPPNPTQLTSLLTKWKVISIMMMKKDPLVQIGLAHYQFEAIHPFMDGNGRIGRLIIPIFLYQKKLLPYPSLCQ
jgi:Fic family protein